MHPEHKASSPIKSRLHVRNRHREQYDFPSLIGVFPSLAAHVQANRYGTESIDFADPAAVRALNTALLLYTYQVEGWSIPEGYLCPPIPGRADYIHHISDLMGAKNYGKIPREAEIRCLDIGVGANCIYPILGHREYGWSFVGSDIDQLAIDAADSILERNPGIRQQVELRLQADGGHFFDGILNKDELFDLTVCNPPFHRSAEEADAAMSRKHNNLAGQKVADPVRNFGGISTELWCQGGEKQFIAGMIEESKRFAKNVFWFTSLVSKSSNVKGVLAALRASKACETKTIPMGQGQKSSRIVAWTFLTPKEQSNWIQRRWQTVEQA
jgi:23S rRNA (adenine1618-N6)-methyltransferase